MVGMHGQGVTGRDCAGYLAMYVYNTLFPATRS